MGTDRRREIHGVRGRGGSLQTSSNPFSSKTRPDARARIEDAPRASTAIDALLDNGCAIIIGKTQDGGAISITILAGEERHRTYCADQEELNDAFDAILGMSVIFEPDGAKKVATQPKLKPIEHEG